MAAKTILSERIVTSTLILIQSDCERFQLEGDGISCAYFMKWDIHNLWILHTYDSLHEMGT